MKTEKSVMDSAIDAFMSGDNNTLDSMISKNEPPKVEAVVEVTESPEESGQSPDEFVFEENVESEETEQAIVETLMDEAQPAITSQDIIEVAFTDHKGKRSAKVDLSDKDTIKKLLSKAFGSTKWKVEKDQLKQEFDTYKKVNDEKVQFFSQLEEAFGDGSYGGIENVIKLLTKDEGAIDSLIAHREAEKQRLAKMDPVERAKLEWEQERLRDRVTHEKRIAELEGREKLTKDQQAKAEEESLKTMAAIAHGKFNFDGKLGNDRTETRLNKALWNDAADLLEEKGITKPTQRQMEAAFQIVYKDLISGYETTSEKKVATRVEQKKAQAAKSAASIVKTQTQVGTKKPSLNEFRKNPGAVLADILLGSKK
jgi:hypothetical protein